MEQEKKSVKNASLNVVFGKGFNINGVDNVVSGTDKEIILSAGGGMLHVTGENLNISKIDVEAGIAEVQGSMHTLKFGAGRAKQSLLRRILK